MGWYEAREEPARLETGGIRTEEVCRASEVTAPFCGKGRALFVAQQQSRRARGKGWGSLRSVNGPPVRSVNGPRVHSVNGPRVHSVNGPPVRSDHGFVVHPSPSISIARW